MNAPESALQQIRVARLYTENLLRQIDEADWFRAPKEAMTTVAWQVGHLAVAEYSLGLRRIRGERERDLTLISADFRQRFGKGSTPVAGPDANLAVEQIREVFEAVHNQVLKENAALPDEAFAEPTAEPPHPMFKTKLESLQWCGQHELIHAGQIALLRRLFGAKPLW